jgi:hypothetical protein
MTNVPPLATTNIEHIQQQPLPFEDPHALDIVVGAPAFDEIVQAAPFLEEQPQEDLRIQAMRIQNFEYPTLTELFQTVFFRLATGL